MAQRAQRASKLDGVRETYLYGAGMWQCSRQLGLTKRAQPARKMGRGRAHIYMIQESDGGGRKVPSGEYPTILILQFVKVKDFPALKKQQQKEATSVPQCGQGPFS